MNGGCYLRIAAPFLLLVAGCGSQTQFTVLQLCQLLRGLQSSLRSGLAFDRRRYLA